MYKTFLTLKITIVIACILLPFKIFAGTDDIYTVNGINYHVSIYYAGATLAAEVMPGDYSGAIKIPAKVQIPEYVNPMEVRAIQEDAFRDCDNVTSISLPEGLTHIYDYAFAGCTNLTTINLPSTLIRLSTGAFENCKKIKSITLPKSLTILGDDQIVDDLDISNYHTNVFKGCTSLTAINVANGNTRMVSKDGIVYNKAMTHLLCCPGAKSSVTIPATVTNINPYALSSCINIRTITIHSHIDQIHESAFEGCSKLATIHIEQKTEDGDGYPTQIFGYRMFADCPNITAIYLKTYFPPVVSENDQIFDASVYKNCTLYVPVETSNGYAQIPVWRLFSKIKESTSATPSKPSTGIDDVICDEIIDTEVHYYDLNGMEVNPTGLSTGIYIKRQGTKAEKIFIQQ